MFLNT